MSHSTKKVCGGSNVCYKTSAVKKWKRFCNKEYRRKVKDPDFIPSNIFKESSDRYGPKDGHRIYWHTRPFDSYLANLYDKEMRK